MTNKLKIASVAFAVSSLAFAGAAHAQIAGTVDATINLESGCIINDVNTADGEAADLGTLDFGTQTTLFDQADAQVNGTGTGIVIQCTAGTVPTLTFQTGANDGEGTGGGGKAMVHTGGTNYVTYDLLMADNSTVIGVGDEIALLDDGSVQTVTVNGRAYGEAGLIGGIYSDTVTVSLEL